MRWLIVVMAAAVLIVGCQQAEYVEHFRSTPPATTSTGEGGSVTQSLKAGAGDMPEGMIFCRWCGHTFVLVGNQWVLWEGRK